MTVRVKHPFTSAKSDGADATQVQPSHWNADHTLQLDGPALVGRAAPGAGAATEIAIAAGLVLDNAGLGVAFDATAPAALGAAAVGVSTAPARRDHVHPMPTAAQVTAMPAYLGDYATLAALQTAFPAAANAGKFATVTTTGKPVPCVSDGAAWCFLARIDSSGRVVDGAGTAHDLGSGAGGGVTPIPFSAVINFQASAAMPTAKVSSVIAFTVDESGAAEGSVVMIDLVANGTAIPTFTGFRQWDGSSGWVNTDNVRNCVTFFRRGGANWYTINQQAGAPTEALPATAITLSSPSGGVVGVASANFTIAANGTLAGSVSVAMSDGGAGGTFTPAGPISISSGTPTATFTYTPASTGAKTISLTNGSGLTNPAGATYTVTATPVVPDAPTSLVASGPTSSSVALAWAAPAYGGTAPITDYIVQYSPAGAGTWTTFADGTSTGLSATVTGLAAATAYDFRVAAVSSAGTGSYSTLASATTLAGTTLVTLQSLFALTETSAGIWTASADLYASRGNAGAGIGLAGDGWVGFDFPTTGNLVIVTLDNAQALTSYGDADYSLWIHSSGTYKTENSTSGALIDSDAAGAAGKRYRLRRAGTTVYAERSTDNGATFTVISTYAAASGVKLYPRWFVGEPGDVLTNPRASGLS